MRVRQRRKGRTIETCLVPDGEKSSKRKEQDYGSLIEDPRVKRNLKVPSFMMNNSHADA